MADIDVTMDTRSDAEPTTAHRGVTPIVALDVSDEQSAYQLVDSLGALCRFYKVGRGAVRRGRSADGAHAQRSADARCSSTSSCTTSPIPFAADVGTRPSAAHGLSPSTRLVDAEMIAAAVQGAREGDPECAVFAVTVLTSLDARRHGGTWGSRCRGGSPAPRRSGA